MILTMMQYLVPKFLLPVLPDQTMSLSPSYQRQNTRPPSSPFQMMCPSLRVLLRMNSSSISWNLTSTNLTIMTASIHLSQSDSLAPPIYIPPQITESKAPCISLQSYLPHKPFILLYTTTFMAYLDATNLLMSRSCEFFSSSNREYCDEEPGGYNPTLWLQSTSTNEAI